MGYVGEIVRTDESLKDDTEVVNVGRVDVKGGRMRDVIKIFRG